MTQDSQIKVQTNSFLPLLSTLLQRGIMALAGSYVVISDDDASRIAAGIIAAGVALWGAYRSYKSNEEKKVMEGYTPDSVATTK